MWPVAFTFEVTNEYDLPRTFQFSSGQQFDIEMIDEAGRVVAAWSDESIWLQFHLSQRRGRFGGSLHARLPTLEDLLDLCRRLNEAGAKYIVIGGMAIIQQGVDLPFATPKFLWRLTLTYREKDAVDRLFLAELL